MMYKLYIAGDATEPNAAMTVGESKVTSFLFDPDNTDYQAYLKWLEEGNTPEPAEVQE